MQACRLNYKYVGVIAGRKSFWLAITVTRNSKHIHLERKLLSEFMFFDENWAGGYLSAAWSLFDSTKNV